MKTRTEIADAFDSITNGDGNAEDYLQDKGACFDLMLRYKLSLEYTDGVTYRFVKCDWSGKRPEYTRATNQNPFLAILDCIATWYLSEK